MNKLRTSFFLLMATALVFAAMPNRNVLAVDDTLGPITSAVAASPSPAAINSTVTVTATVDDTTTGGSNIQSAEFSVNGGAWAPLNASDGAFDSATENVTGSFILMQSGDNEVCVRGTDAIPNIGDSVCVTVTGEQEDLLGPITSGVATSPNPAVVNSTVTVTALVDDTTTGGSNIQSAEFSVNGGAWTPMSASDSAFDSVAENVTGSFTLTQSGDTEVCVRGTDVIPNIGDSACVTLVGQYEFTFKGFRPPVRMGVDNRVNAPRTIPVKWRLTLADGTPVSDFSSFVALKSYQVDCSTREGDPSTAVIEPSLGSGLLYLGNGNWLFRWKTSKEYRHTCRVMFVEFSDGQTSPEVFFIFR